MVQSRAATYYMGVLRFHWDAGSHTISAAPKPGWGPSNARTMLPSMAPSLTTREKRILQLRYGLIDGHSRPLEQVARRFGVTPGRVEQLERGAIEKLRALDPDADWRDYLR